MQFAYFTTVIDDTVSVIIIIVVVIVVKTLNWNLQRGIEEGEKTFLRVCNLAGLPLIFIILLLFLRYSR